MRSIQEEFCAEELAEHIAAQNPPPPPRELSAEELQPILDKKALDAKTMEEVGSPADEAPQDPQPDFREDMGQLAGTIGEKGAGAQEAPPDPGKDPLKTYRESIEDDTLGKDERRDLITGEAYDQPVDCPEPVRINGGERAADFTMEKIDGNDFNSGCPDYVIARGPGKRGFRMTDNTLTIKGGVRIDFEEGAALTIGKDASIKTDGLNGHAVVLSGVKKERGGWWGLRIFSQTGTNYLGGLIC